MRSNHRVRSISTPRRQSKRNPGMDRHPSGPTCSVSSSTVHSGLTMCTSTPSARKTNTRSPTPICGAASPTPCATYMDSNMLSHNLANSSSNFSTGFAGDSRTAFPYFVIG